MEPHIGPSPTVRTAMRRPPSIDLLLAGGLLVWALLEALLLDGSGSRPERAAWAVAIAAPIALRRRYPFGVAVAVAAIVALRVAVAGGQAEEGAMPFPAILLATFSVAAHGASIRLAAAGGAAAYLALLSAVATG